MLRPGGGVETRPTPMCRVRIRTKGQLENGAAVDKHHSVPFTLGDGDVIQGGCGSCHNNNTAQVVARVSFPRVCLAWDLTVSLMEVGEVSLVNTSPRFAYGKQGRYIGKQCAIINIHFHTVNIHNTLHIIYIICILLYTCTGHLIYQLMPILPMS